MFANSIRLEIARRGNNIFLVYNLKAKWNGSVHSCRYDLHDRAKEMERFGYWKEQISWVIYSEHPDLEIKWKTMDGLHFICHLDCREPLS